VFSLRGKKKGSGGNRSGVKTSGKNWGGNPWDGFLTIAEDNTHKCQGLVRFLSNGEHNSIIKRTFCTFGVDPTTSHGVQNSWDRRGCLQCEDKYASGPAIGRASYRPQSCGCQAEHNPTLSGVGKPQERRRQSPHVETLNYRGARGCPTSGSAMGVGKRKTFLKPSCMLNNNGPGRKAQSRNKCYLTGEGIEGKVLACTNLNQQKSLEQTISTF